ncbi:MAG TPA: DUF402 domain-containing protein [Frankiaceae bacterium]|nr:DUF402 domain-containing protein [Frankiaceae bacterium]
MAWEPGQVIRERHLCGDGVWGHLPNHVVLDSPSLVVTYLAGGAPMAYEPGPWPTATGMHPWHPRPAWSGHGLLKLQRPGDPYGAWVVWEGEQRSFACWYLNIHEWSRDDDGFSIRDLELDVVVRDGVPRLKDEELLDVRVAEGRLSVADVAHARAVADALVAMVERGGQWWDAAWAEWTPPPGWDA